MEEVREEKDEDENRKLVGTWVKRNRYRSARRYPQSPYVADSVQWKPAFPRIKRLVAGNLIRSWENRRAEANKSCSLCVFNNEDEVGQEQRG